MRFVLFLLCAVASDLSRPLKEISLQGLESFDQFRDRFKGGQLVPARLLNVTDKWKVRKWKFPDMLAKIGSIEVWPRDLRNSSVSSAARIFNQTVREYLIAASPSNLSVYEGTFCPSTLAMQEHYTIPKPFRQATYSMPVFGLSRKGTGVGFHRVHAQVGGGAWYAQVYGSTTWRVSDEELSESTWPFAEGSASRSKQTCVLKEGDAIFVPANYFRAWIGNNDTNLIIGFQGPETAAQTMASSPAVDAMWSLMHHITKGDASAFAKAFRGTSESAQLLMPSVDHAMQVGHIPILQKLHDLGASFDDEDPSGSSILHTAASMGQAEAMHFAIQRGALTNSRTLADGRYAIHNAAQAGHVSALEVLLAKSGKKPYKAKDRSGKTALHLAVQQGHTAAAQTLLAASAGTGAKDRDGYTPLHWAIEGNQATVLDLLLRSQADIGAVTNSGETALYRAAVKGHAALSEQLLRNGAKVETPSKDGKRATHVAAFLGHMDVLQLLHSRGANLAPASREGHYSPEALASAAGHTAALQFIRRHVLQMKEIDDKEYEKTRAQTMHAALQAGHMAMLEEVFKLTAGPGLRHPQTRLSLAHDSIGYGHISLLKGLMKEGDYLKIEGSNALMQKAAKHGHTKVLDWLAEGGVGVNSAPLGENGTETERPLVVATSEGHLPAVKHLLLLRAKVNHLSSNQMSAVHLAVMQGNAKVLAVLLKNGGDTKADESSGREHLHVAAAVGHAKVAKALLDSGANVMAFDKGGFPAHFLAAEHGHAPVIKLLQERRANLDFSLRDPNSPKGDDARQANALSIAASKGHIPLIKYFLKDKSLETSREIAKRFGQGHDAKWHAKLEDALELDARERAAKNMNKAIQDPEKRANIQKFNEEYQKMTLQERAAWDRQMAEKSEHEEAKRKYEKLQKAKRVSRPVSEL